MTTDRFDELQDGRKLTIKRADGGLLLTIATMHRMETVPLTEERTDDLARWLGGDEAQAERTKLALSEERRIAAERYMRERNEAVVERDEWEAIARSTEETLKLQQGASIDQLEEANRTGQAMGSTAERERVVTFLDGIMARWAEVKTDESRHRISTLQAARDCIYNDTTEVRTAQPADPLRPLTTTELDQVPPVDDAAVDRALMAGWAERTAAETPRSPTEPAAGYVIDVDPSAHQGYGFTPRAVFPPQVAPGMQGAIDATHAHSAIVLASAKEGTPAPEPRPSTEWLEANVPHALLRALLSHAESTILIGHEPMNDHTVYESACPFCGAACNQATREPHDEDCVGEQARRWLAGTPGSTEP